MGIREKINQSKPLSFGLAAGVFAAAAAFYLWTSHDGLRGAVTQAYFSDDDGKSYFVASTDLVPPFDHNGKEAVQAMVYRAGSNPPFVAYLQRYDADVAKRLRDLAAGPQGNDTAATLMELRGRAKVKRPGNAAWSAVDSGEGSGVVTIAPPAGQTGELQSVNP